MSLTLSELLSQRATLDEQIAQIQQAERTQALETIRELMQRYGLTPADLQGKAGSVRSSSKTKPEARAPKFRNPDTGATWSGRGPRPLWLRAAIDSGKSPSDFAI